MSPHPDCDNPHLTAMAERLRRDSNYRNSIRSCPLCNSNIADRKATLFTSLIESLYKVYCWCGEHQCHEFTTKQIRHLLDRNSYARFGDLVRFGGIVYKPKVDGKACKAFFGINMIRAKEFFKGDRQIPVQITLNQITGEIIESRYVSVGEFPSLKELLKDGLYNHQQDLLNA